SDKLSKWFPDFPNADRITLDDLLRMRSGIPDPFDPKFIESYYDHPLMDFTEQDSIERAAALSDQFEPPGQTTRYTEVNYVLLGEIVRKVSGNPLGVQIEKMILRSLGMEHSLYPTSSRLPGDLRGYRWNPQIRRLEDKTELNPAVPAGAGAMISNLADLKTYARALCTGTLLNPRTQRARLQSTPFEGQPEFAQYGQGIAKIGSFCGHNGAIVGFSTEMWYLPEKDAIVVINVNRLDTDDQAPSLLLFLAVGQIVFPEYFAFAAMPPTGAGGMADGEVLPVGTIAAVLAAMTVGICMLLRRRYTHEAITGLIDIGTTLYSPRQRIENPAAKEEQ
ncbi:MAG: beta-lactamase family protein, partial [Chloroflexota bacterium]|nr:beta-lactamase family protein [Chloroflexota bacterium]